MMQESVLEVVPLSVVDNCVGSEIEPQQLSLMAASITKQNRLGIRVAAALARDEKDDGDGLLSSLVLQRLAELQGVIVKPKIEGKVGLVC
jgi:hypothetical protein